MFSHRPGRAIKRAIKIILLIITLTGGMALKNALIPEALPAYNPHNLIRLHVIANSDTAEDQDLKREVRDVVLAEAREQLKRAQNVDEARRWLADNLATLTAVAEKRLERQGNPYPVKAQWGDFAFPTRAYGSLVLPAGQYEAVRLIIGEGKGENWWCVLFPPLCLVDVADSGAAREVMTRPGGPPQLEHQVELRFKILEVLKASSQRLASLWSGTEF